MKFLILSERLDKSTDLIIEWFIAFKKDVFRLNYEDSSKYNFSYYTSDQSVKITSKINNSTFILDKNTVVWNRRGYIPFRPNNYEKRIGRDIETFLAKEASNLINSVDLILKARVKKYIGSWQKEQENYKLLNLFYADKVGLLTPDTIITNNKADFITFCNQQKKIISKSISSLVFFANKEFTMGNGTFVVKKEMINSLNDTFEPTLLQSYIKKQYEIRAYVFDKTIFSMAIFSTNWNDESIDYRINNDSKTSPNRCIPVKLPNEIRDKLLAFMKLSELDTGSIDLIVTPDDEYYC